MNALNGTIRLNYAKKLQTILDSLTFSKILIFWSLIVILFGLIYFLFSTSTTTLYNNIDHFPTRNILDHVYFSFVAATTAGFGDIVPLGLFKIASIIEIIFGVIFLALITSKIVSIKQDVILGEIYEISFAEKINRLRSSLFLFRQNLNRIIAKTEEGTIKKREISEMYHYLSFFEDTLKEIEKILEQEKKSSYTKKIDPVSIELIYISILDSFEKLSELLNLLELNNKEWKKEITITLIKRGLEQNSNITEQIKAKNLLVNTTFNEHASRWNNLNTILTSLLKTPEKEEPKIEIVDINNGIKTEPQNSENIVSKK